MFYLDHRRDYVGTTGAVKVVCILLSTWLYVTNYRENIVWDQERTWGCIFSKSPRLFLEPTPSSSDFFLGSKAVSGSQCNYFSKGSGFIRGPNHRKRIDFGTGHFLQASTTGDLSNIF